MVLEFRKQEDGNDLGLDSLKQSFLDEVDRCGTIDEAERIVIREAVTIFFEEVDKKISDPEFMDQAFERIEDKLEEAGFNPEDLR